MKRIIGWAANFFPRHVFYSNDFGDLFNFDILEGESDDVHATEATTALIAVAVASGRNLTKAGQTLVSEFTGVTSGGKIVGNFKITVERLHDDTRQPNK